MKLLSNLSPFNIYLNSLTSYDYILKYQVRNPYLFDNFVKLELVFIGANLNFKAILNSIIFFEMVTSQKPTLISKKKTKYTKGNIKLTIAKTGTIMGCKITLRKALFYRFYNVLVLNHLYKLNLDVVMNDLIKKENHLTQNITVSQKNLTSYTQIEAFYLNFQDIKSYSLNFVFKNKLTIKQICELLYLPYPKSETH